MNGCCTGDRVHVLWDVCVLYVQQTASLQTLRSSCLWPVFSQPLEGNTNTLQQMCCGCTLELYSIGKLSLQICLLLLRWKMLLFLYPSMCSKTLNFISILTSVMLEYNDRVCFLPAIETAAAALPPPLPIWNHIVLSFDDGVESFCCAGSIGMC